MKARSFRTKRPENTKWQGNLGSGPFRCDSAQFREPFVSSEAVWLHLRGLPGSSACLVTLRGGKRLRSAPWGVL